MTGAVIQNNETAFMAAITPPPAQQDLVKEERLGMMIQG